MEYLSKGGYAEVFYDKVNGDIYRRLPRRNSETKQVEVSSFCDLIFTRSMEHTGYTPVIYNEEICKDYVSFRMPYYGVSLHHWVRQESIETRREYASFILLQVVLACIHFEKNAFCHTDIKPLNIMIETLYPQDASNKDKCMNEWRNVLCHRRGDSIEEDCGEESEDEDERVSKYRKTLRVKVIDFNCSSVKTIDHKNQMREWSYGIGTWHYMPPEIILYEMPFTNSLSWTIGVIAAYIIEGYPFRELLKERNDKELLEQDVWKELVQQWCVDNQEHIVFPRNRYYGDTWNELIYHCTHWRCADRWCLTRIYNYIYDRLFDRTKPDILYVMPPHAIMNIHTTEHQIHTTRLPEELRVNVIETMYSICENMDKMMVFPTGVAIFDRICYVMTEEEIQGKVAQLAAGSFLLSCFLNNVNILTSRTYMTRMLNSFACINRTHALAALCYIGQLLSWKLWEKPSHIYVIECEQTHHWDRSLFEHIKSVLIGIDGVYTQHWVAEKVLKRMGTHPAPPLPSPRKENDVTDCQTTDPDKQSG